MDKLQLESETLSLPIKDRARLATKLLLSLEAPEDEDNLHLWVAEAQRRLDELNQGVAREIPAEEVFADIRRTLA